MAASDTAAIGFYCNRGGFTQQGFGIHRGAVADDLNVKGKELADFFRAVQLPQLQGFTQRGVDLGAAVRLV
jgi:hypothetical protein